MMVHDSSEIQEAINNTMRLPWEGSTEVFGLGQSSTVIPKDLMTKVQDYALYLIAAGALIGVVGVIPLKDTPWSQIVATIGGFLMAAGLVPVLLGAF